jgi:hypothetical protein
LGRKGGSRYRKRETISSARIRGSGSEAGAIGKLLVSVRDSIDGGTLRKRRLSKRLGKCGDFEGRDPFGGYFVPALALDHLARALRFGFPALLSPRWLAEPSHDRSSFDPFGPAPLARFAAVWRGTIPTKGDLR